MKKKIELLGTEISETQPKSITIEYVCDLTGKTAAKNA